MRVVDLSFPVKPHFRWKVATELRTSHAKGDLFQSTMLTVHCHAFTHVDAPCTSCRGIGTSRKCPWTSGSETRPSWISPISQRAAR
jgi:kynurenine formamidase